MPRDGDQRAVADADVGSRRLASRHHRVTFDIEAVARDCSGSSY
jgi:hypothetical protein